MARTKSNGTTTSTATIGFEVSVLVRRDLAAGTVQNDPPRLQVFSYEALISAARTHFDWLLAELKTGES